MGSLGMSANTKTYWDTLHNLVGAIGGPAIVSPFLARQGNKRGFEIASLVSAVGYALQVHWSSQHRVLQPKCLQLAAPVTYSSCGAPTGELVLGQQPDTDDAAVPARLQPHAGTCTEVLCNASRNAARVAPRRLLTADDGACCSSGPLQISLQCGLWWSSRA